MGSIEKINPNIALVQREFNFAKSMSNTMAKVLCTYQEEGTVHRKPNQLVDKTEVAPPEIFL